MAPHPLSGSSNWYLGLSQGVAGGASKPVPYPGILTGVATAPMPTANTMPTLRLPLRRQGEPFISRVADGVYQITFHEWLRRVKSGDCLEAGSFRNLQADPFPHIRRWVEVIDGPEMPRNISEENFTEAVVEGLFRPGVLRLAFEDTSGPSSGVYGWRWIMEWHRLFHIVPHFIPQDKKSYEENLKEVLVIIKPAPARREEYEALLKTQDEVIAKEEERKKRAALPITLDVLVKVTLPKETKEEIVSVLNQHTQGKKLFDEWGLGEVIEYGRGMIFLFWGTPGTGKTYTAKLMAEAIGKELMIVGAAELQSSIPGEMERNLKAAFEEAKKKQAILLFDECDGMIQSRQGMGQIMSSENNTFLTEIEKHEGIVVLTTNRVDALDEALERRTSLIIEFKHPDQDQRKDIWKRLLPKKMPLDKDVSIDSLSEHYLTGGEIKNVVLNAARYAVGRNENKVKRDDFIRAIERVHTGKRAFKDRRNTGHNQRVYPNQGGKGKDIGQPEIIKDMGEIEKRDKVACDPIPVTKAV